MSAKRSSSDVNAAIARLMKKYYARPSKARYLEIVREVDGPSGIRETPRIVSVGEARLIVMDAIQENGADPDGVCDALAGLLARALSGEAMYHHLQHKLARNLRQEQGTGNKPRTNITPEIREAIIRADRDLKRAGMSVKKDRNDELAKRFDIPADTVRKVTPQLARGRPKKRPGNP